MSWMVLKESLHDYDGRAVPQGSQPPFLFNSVTENLFHTPAAKSPTPMKIKKEGDR